VGIGGRQRPKHLDASRDHLVVVRDQPADLDVVALGVDVEVAFDRMPRTGRPSTQIAFGGSFQKNAFPE
jgi:hypothetical protein